MFNERDELEMQGGQGQQGFSEVSCPPGSQMVGVDVWNSTQ